jgi:hypothetical protein
MAQEERNPAGDVSLGVLGEDLTVPLQQRIVTEKVAQEERNSAADISLGVLGEDLTVPPHQQHIIITGGEQNQFARVLYQASSSDVPVVNVSAETAYVHQYAKKKGSYSIAEYGFKRSQAVNGFIRVLVEAKQFTLASIKRVVHQHLVVNQRTALSQQVLRKPNGNHIAEMFDSHLMQSGNISILSGTCPLKSERFLELHRMACGKCAEWPTGTIAPGCRFESMLRCITHGWLPPVAEDRIRPVYRVHKGNYPGVARFDTSSRKEFHKMISNQTVIRREHSAPNGVRSPLGTVVKNADITRARMLVNIEVSDQVTLDRANEALEARGDNPIKARIISDITAPGINRAAYSPPFSYPSLQDGIRMLKRHCYIGKCDVSRYFHSFPLAYSIRHLFEVEFDGELFTYARCPFGFSPCPYYCSTWSAEFKSWLKALGIDTAHLMDDWLVVEDTLDGVNSLLDRVVEMFESVGFSMAAEKNERGQVLTFLGVHLDTTKMTMRFDSTQSRAMKEELQMYVKQLVQRSSLGHSTVRHVCGKLNWYSEVVQSGRLHLSSWWDYDKFGEDLYDVTHNRLLVDTQWWISLLEAWEQDRSMGIEYSILSADELLKNPESILVVQSDASGTDGFGYYFGFARDDDLTWVSKRWLQDHREVSSHTDEMHALCDFLEHECRVRDAVLVWVTDSESAMWSVNKGRCFEEAGLVVLTRILALCDLYRLQIVALWVPREMNELADYLSHLAFSVDRDQVSGTWAADDIFSGPDGATHRQQTTPQGYSGTGEPLLRGRAGSAPETVPSLPSRSVRVPRGVRGRAGWVEQVRGTHRVVPGRVQPLQQPALAERFRSASRQGPHQGAPVPRSFPRQASVADHGGLSGGDGRHHGPYPTFGVAGGNVNGTMPQQSNALGRADEWNLGRGHRVGPRGPQSHGGAFPYQDTSSVRHGVHQGRGLPGSQRLQAGQAMVRHVGPLGRAQGLPHSTQRPRTQGHGQLRLRQTGDHRLVQARDLVLPRQGGARPDPLLGPLVSGGRRHGSVRDRDAISTDQENGSVEIRRSDALLPRRTGGG